MSLSLAAYSDETKLGRVVSIVSFSDVVWRVLQMPIFDWVRPILVRADGYFLVGRTYWCDCFSLFLLGSKVSVEYFSTQSKNLCVSFISMKDISITVFLLLYYYTSIIAHGFSDLCLGFSMPNALESSFGFSMPNAFGEHWSWKIRPTQCSPLPDFHEGVQLLHRGYFELMDLFKTVLAPLHPCPCHDQTRALQRLNYLSP